MRCLEPSEIERYVSGLMDRKVADEVTAHLEGCQRCRRAVAEARERVAAPGEDRGTLRVQCSGCGARYGIPEERARGRVLKVRCKSCGTILEVRGASSPGRSVLDRSRKQWFLVIHRERVGPMTDVEVRERFQKGEIRPRTYAWRQGFTRWERLQGIAEFQDLVNAPPEKPKRPTRPLAELGGTTDSARTLPGKAAGGTAGDDGEEALDFDGAGDTAKRTVNVAGTTGREDETARMQADVVAAALLRAKIEGGKQGEPASTDEHETQLHVKGPRDPLAGFNPVPLGFDISKPESPRGASLPAAEPSPDPAPVERSQLSPGEFERHMRGQRSEDSVLFSLNHLKQIAAKPPVKPKQSSGFTGLFDIRPLQVGPPPVLLPVESSPRSGVSVWLVIGVGVSGVMIGALTLFAILYLVRPELVRDLAGKRTVAPHQPGGAREVVPVVTPLGKGHGSAAAAVRPDAARAPAVVKDTKVAPPSKKEAVKPEPKAVLAKAEPKPKPEEKTVKAEPRPVAKVEAKPVKKARRKRPAEGIEVVDPGAPEPKNEADTPPEKPEPVEKPAPKAKKKSDEEELDRLIDGATDKPIPKKKTQEGAQPKPEAEPKKEGPALSRDQIAAGMKRAVGAVQICNEKFQQTGMVTVDVTIDPSGRITRGRVLGSFAESAIGACVLEAVKRNARFPTFVGAPITIQYPFALR